jgi:uncharacterized protein YfeS
MRYAITEDSYYIEHEGEYYGFAIQEGDDVMKEVTDFLSGFYDIEGGYFTQHKPEGVLFEESSI